MYLQSFGGVTYRMTGEAGNGSNTEIAANNDEAVKDAEQINVTHCSGILFSSLKS